MKEFRMILSFFTRIPVGNLEFKEGLFEKSFKWTTAVGLVIGLILGGVDYLLRGKSTLITGFILMLAYIIITGALHLDGLSDSCDGLFSGRSKERVLEIMKDSRVGAFGVLSLIIIIIGYVIFLGQANLLMVITFPIVGKTALHIASKSSYYCKEAGMGKAFVENGGTKACIVVATIVNCALFLLEAYKGEYSIIIAVIITYIIAYWIIKKIEKKIDGISGDILGFIAEISQLIFLIIGVILF
ncbi:adenosylcobinamide-GDP ribazoletransferase [Clostridium massiliamazoniense]|uniref:adenosylcobinamide-GDP ribazoletransferase n=1 Tax=Clostridium massiliamazoniense TaxID=1347366 RepID=UPI0006D82BF1|nr:adenosylcobinamide-GDP ribazoletransferase [Clostridium massiliamazoniense]